MRKRKYVFLLCSSTNFDRIVATHNAHTATSHGVFCCDRYQKDQLKTLAEYSGKYHPMFDIRNAEELSLGDRHLLNRMTDDGFTMLVRGNSRFETWMDLITRMMDSEQCILIYSQYPGYIDPKDPAYIKSLSQFIASQRCEMITCHTTGHAYAETIAKVCKVVNPTTAIIPIHKEDKTTETFGGKIKSEYKSAINYKAIHSNSKRSERIKKLYEKILPKRTTCKVEDSELRYQLLHATASTEFSMTDIGVMMVIELKTNITTQRQLELNKTDFRSFMDAINAIDLHTNEFLSYDAIICDKKIRCIYLAINI